MPCSVLEGIWNEAEWSWKYQRRWAPRQLPQIAFVEVKTSWQHGHSVIGLKAGKVAPELNEACMAAACLCGTGVSGQPSWLLDLLMPLSAASVCRKLNLCY